MCYWHRREPDAEFTLTKEEGRVAFKRLAYTAGDLRWDGWENGGFKSPRGTRWNNLTIAVRGALRRGRYGDDNGVYCFKTKKGATEYSATTSLLVVKLRVWGEVFEYHGRRRTGRWGLNEGTYAGYRVTRARIEEVFLPARWNAKKRDAFAKHLASAYPNLKVTLEGAS